MLDDYNLPSATFSNSEKNFKEQMFNLILSRYNNIININGTTLDKIISNRKNTLIEENVSPLVIIDKFHPPLSIYYTNNHLQYLNFREPICLLKKKKIINLF